MSARLLRLAACTLGLLWMRYGYDCAHSIVDHASPDMRGAAVLLAIGLGGYFMVAGVLLVLASLHRAR